MTCGEPPNRPFVNIEIQANLMSPERANGSVMLQTPTSGARRNPGRAETGEALSDSRTHRPSNTEALLKTATAP